ncbi:hypothetical protein AGMMS49975_09700 [Clostridia bacterium]|nr:hypothetical protein AGMMS49975_09700 [Clostridia bacterium]
MDNAYWRAIIEGIYLGAIGSYCDVNGYPQPLPSSYRLRLFNLMQYMETDADWEKLKTDLDKILKAYAYRYTYKLTDFAKLDMELGNLLKNLKEEKPQKELELAKLEAKAEAEEAKGKKISLIAGGVIAACIVWYVCSLVSSYGTAAPPRTSSYTGSGYDQQTQDNLRKAGAPYGKSAGEAGRTIENMLRNK